MYSILHFVCLIFSMQILQSFSVLLLLLSLLLLLQLPSGFPHSLKSRFLSLLLNIFLPQSVRFIKRGLPSQLTESTLEFPLSVGVGWSPGDTNTEFLGC